MHAPEETRFYDLEHFLTQLKFFPTKAHLRGGFKQQILTSRKTIYTTTRSLKLKRSCKTTVSEEKLKTRVERGASWRSL